MENMLKGLSLKQRLIMWLAHLSWVPTTVVCIKPCADTRESLFAITNDEGSKYLKDKLELWAKNPLEDKKDVSKDLSQLKEINIDFEDLVGRVVLIRDFDNLIKGYSCLDRKLDAVEIQSCENGCVKLRDQWYPGSILKNVVSILSEEQSEKEKERMSMDGVMTRAQIMARLKSLEEALLMIEERSYLYLPTREGSMTTSGASSPFPGYSKEDRLFVPIKLLFQKLLDRLEMYAMRSPVSGGVIIQFKNEGGLNSKADPTGEKY